MTRSQLEHAIRAACDVSGDTEVWVFGSQAILGEFPDAPGALRRSMEVDIAPKNHPERVDDIDGVLGELSLFHETHDFYVHGVPIETAVLPEAWEFRTYRLRNANTHDCTGYCLDGHDLAASKLAAFRDKDRDFVRVLLVEGLIRADELLKRISWMDVAPELRDRMESWVQALSAELQDAADPLTRPGSPRRRGR